nr:immunoglobulin light chain junction region [Macaca mulatta]MPO10572.1 immunoglobulin light chain junction region [Macaca mulatta]
CSSYAGSNVLC